MLLRKPLWPGYCPGHAHLHGTCCCWLQTAACSQVHILVVACFLPCRNASQHDIEFWYVMCFNCLHRCKLAESAT